MQGKEGRQSRPPPQVPEELGPSEQRGLGWGPGGRGDQTPGHGHITGFLPLGSKKVSTSPRGAGNAWLSVSPCAEDTRDSEMNISFILLFDLKRARKERNPLECNKQKHRPKDDSLYDPDTSSPTAISVQ